MIHNPQQCLEWIQHDPSITYHTPPLTGVRVRDKRETYQTKYSKIKSKSQFYKGTIVFGCFFENKHDISPRDKLTKSNLELSEPLS